MRVGGGKGRSEVVSVDDLMYKLNQPMTEETGEEMELSSIIIHGLGRIYRCVYVCLCVYVYAFMYVHTHMRVYAYMCLCVYA